MSGTKVFISLLPFAYDEILPQVGIEIDSEGFPVIDFDEENEDSSKVEFYNKWEGELTILKNIADSEHCDYCDVSAKRVWNPKQTKDIISFVYDIGFVRPLRKKRPVSDMVRTLFCWE